MGSDEKTVKDSKREFKVLIRGGDGKVRKVEETSFTAAAEAAVGEYLQGVAVLNTVVGGSLEVVVLDGDQAKFFDVQVSLSLEVEEL
jgi:hypothetical protein